MLPQQSLMLRVAAESIGDARWDRSLALRTGVLIGIGLDWSATQLPAPMVAAPTGCGMERTLRGCGLSPEQLARWTKALRGAAGPALTANRTMGSLGGLIASRIAREFGIGGPSFTVSCDETSGIQALAIAAEWLGRGELDAAIVGAVDFAGDIRGVLARHRLIHGLPPGNAPGGAGGHPEYGSFDCACDGAVALVLKRLDDAQRDGNRIYAVVRSTGGGVFAGEHTGATEQVSARVGYLEIAGGGWVRPGDREPDAETPCAVGSIMDDLGWAGAATGLAAVAKVAICLDQQMIPGVRKSSRWPNEVWSQARGAVVPEGPQFWVRNRAEGPRRAAVSATSLCGRAQHVVLEEFEGGNARHEPAGGTIAPERSQPLGPRPISLFALEADDEPGLLARIDELATIAHDDRAAAIEALARRWWHRHRNQPGLRFGLAIVADGPRSLARLLGEAAKCVRGGRGPGRPRLLESGRLFYRGFAPLASNRLAFLYPGLGSHFPGMGRELSALWPEVLRAQDATSGFLREQLDPAIWWSRGPCPAPAGHLDAILGTVSVATVVTDLLAHFGVKPDAAIGYSLGESTALVALKAWSDRDLLLGRLRSSPLFQTELAGDCDAARGSGDSRRARRSSGPSGSSRGPRKTCRAAIAGKSRVYVLIKNTAFETVIGGSRTAVYEVASALDRPLFELPTSSAMHCEIGGAALADYRSLYDLETVTPAGVTFYSGVRGRPYAVDRHNVAEAMTDLATRTIDFPAVIERAYADGVRLFVEIGPGNSCTRLVDQILGERPIWPVLRARPITAFSIDS